MKLIKPFFLLNLVLVFVSFSALAQKSEYLDSLTLRELFINKSFEKLTSKITAYQKRYEEDITKEIAFQLAFEVFIIPDPSYEDLFEEWIKQSPDSYIPFFARGHYFIKMGWYKRGSKFAGKTSDSQFEQLHYYHTKAIEDINKAISLKPELSILYAIKIDAAKGLSDYAVKMNALKDGLKISPASYEIRKNYLFSILLRWGGTYEEMDSFLIDTKKYEHTNINLKPLAGFVDYVKGMRALDNRQFEEGIKHLTKAIKYGDKHWFFTERARCYFYLKNYDKALSDLNYSLELHPESIEALLWRSWVYRKKGMYAEALGDLDLAARLEPYNFKVIKNRAYVLTKFNQFDEAVDDFKRAVKLNNKHSKTWSYLGWYAAFKLNDNQTAANAYSQAIKLAPNNTNYLYNYALVLNNMHDCKMTPVLKKYLQLCKVERSKQCPTKDINWAKQMITFLANSNTCPK